MSFMLRQIHDSAKLSDEVALDALAEALPMELLQQVVAESGVAEQRTRKLPAHLVALLCVAMNLFTHDALEGVLAKLLKGLRFLWPDPEFVTAGKGAISMARYRLGARVMAQLFHRVCSPLAIEESRGAFLFGLRLVAIDGTREDVPDTPENARAFGRPQSGRAPGAFPQVLCVYLSECGTHATLDAGFWRCTQGEPAAARRLLRSVEPDMLLTWDRGLHSFDMAAATRARGVHFLGRVPAHVRFDVEEVLSDGSALAWIYPSHRRRRRQGERLLVRVITYTLDDPLRVGYGRRHRLMSSLLEAHAYPALELVCAYHERWEVELAIDEMDTHQRPVRQPLRSQKPVGVIQELYGLIVAHWCVRKVMHEAALAADLDPDRLSFTAALRLICEAVPEFQMVAPWQRERLYERLLRDIARARLPDRDNRINPRVVKQKMSNFKKKRAADCKPRHPTKPFRRAVVLN